MWLLERFPHWLDGDFVDLDMRRRCQSKYDRIDNILGLQHWQPLVVLRYQIGIHQSWTYALCEVKA